MIFGEFGENFQTATMVGESFITFSFILQQQGLEQFSVD